MDRWLRAALDYVPQWVEFNLKLDSPVFAGQLAASANRAVLNRACTTGRPRAGHPPPDTRKGIGYN